MAKYGKRLINGQHLLRKGDKRFTQADAPEGPRNRWERRQQRRHAKRGGR